MKVMTIVGISGSGKTTVAEGLIAALRGRGLRVASAKSIACGRGCKHAGSCKGCGQGFTIDTPGSNSYRHRQAGSQLVITRAAGETAVLFQEELSLSRLLPFFLGYDYVVLEGDYAAPVPRIVTGWKEEDVEERLCAPAFAVSGRAAAGREALFGLPAFDVTTPEGIEGLAELTLRMAAPWPGFPAAEFALRDSGGRELPLPESLREALLTALSAGEDLPAGGTLTIRLPGEGRL